MPIFRFFAVAGGWLLALLFVADATLKSHGPLFTNNSEGLTRPEPGRMQTAQRAPEAPPKKEAKRAQEAPQPPMLVPASQLAPAAKPVAPPIAAIGEAVEAPPAAAQTETEVVTYPELPRPQPVTTEPANTAVAKAEMAKTEPIKTEPAKTEPTRIEAAKVDAGVAEPAKQDAIKREAIAATPQETPRETAPTTPAPKVHKQIARKPERGNRYAAYRDNQTTTREGVPTVDNGYAYGVAPGRARAERQQSWGGEFGQGRYRF